MGSNDESRQPLLEDDGDADEHSPVRITSANSTTTTARRRAPRFSLIDFKPLNGIPFRSLEPSKNGILFTCRAFSADGTCLATGDMGGCIRLWRTTDYKLVAEKSKAFDHAIDCLRFIQNENDRLIAVDTRGYYRCLNLPWSDDENQLDATSVAELSCSSFSLVDGERFLNDIPKPLPYSDTCKHQFSRNGRILLRIKSTGTYFEPEYEIRTIEVIKLGGSIPQVIHLDEDRKYQKGFPLLSKNGEGVLVCSMLNTEVWPKLDFEAGSGHQHSMTLDGTRAVWGLQGQYLLLWKTTDNIESSTKQSTIFVYKTEDLRRHHSSGQLKPFWDRKFPAGQSRYEAQMLKPLSASDKSVEVLIAEMDVHGNRRVLIWDILTDTARNQIMIPAEKETRVFKTHPAFGGRQDDESVNDPQSEQDDEFHKLCIIESVHPKFCISKNRQWIGTISRRFQSCSIVSVKSGATVWSSGFAQRLQVGPIDMPIKAIFDPSGDYFLVMGECAIMVCAPEFLHEKPHAEECDQTFLRAYTCLPSQSLASALEVREYNSGVSSWIDDVTRTISHNNYISDATQSADGKRLAFIVSNRETSSQPIGSAKIVCFEKGEGRAFPDLAFKDAGTEAASESFIPNRLFFYDNDNGPNQGLVAFSVIDKPTATFIDIRTRKMRENDLENIDRCLRISQTADRKKVTILDIRKVIILDLRSETTSEMEYKVNFRNILEMVTAKSKRKRRTRLDRREENTQRRVSDDGCCVLLSWDEGRKESIVVHPSSGQQEVEDLLKQPNRQLSDHCTLSSDGKATCFIDMCEIPSDRITVGIFNESDRKAFHRIHLPFGSLKPLDGSFFDASDRTGSIGDSLDNIRKSISRALGCRRTMAFYRKPTNKSQDPEALADELSDVFCGASDDSSEIFLDGGHLHHRFPYEQGMRRIRRFTFSDTEGSTMGYRRLDARDRDDINDCFQKLAKRNGPSFVNTPYGSGQSFFREAFRNGDKEVVKCCVDHAVKTGVLLDVGDVPCFDDVKEEAIEPACRNIVEKLKDLWHHWWSITDTENDRPCREGSSDILSVALDEKSKERVKEAVELICSPITPFRSAAWLMKRYYKQLWKEYPEVIMHVLYHDSVFSETCQPRVYDKCLNLASWKDKALHQGTSDTVSNWEFIDLPDRLDKRNGLKDQKIVEVGENEEDVATVLASLKFLRIEDATRIGMNGIIRPLLMRNAPVDIFRSKAVKAVTQYKWLTYWRKGFRWYVAPYALFMAVFTTYAIFVARSSAVCKGKYSDIIVKHCCLILMILFGLKMLYEEVSQLCTYMEDGRAHLGSRMRGVAYFFRSKWNWLDLASCTFLLLFIPTLHLSACLTSGEAEDSGDVLDKALSATLAVEAIIASIKGWYFAQPFRIFGALVLMVLNVIVDCFAFLVLSSAVVFGFGLALHILHRHATEEAEPDHNDDDEKQGDFTGDYGSLHKSLLTLFYALFGSFDADFPGMDGGMTALFTLFFAFYMIGAVILLLNLLIAIMGDTFDKIKSSEESQKLMARAKFIDAYEASLRSDSKKDFEKETGKYLHILEYADGSAVRKMFSSWTGKLRMLEERFESCIMKVGDNLKADLEKHDENLKRKLKKQDEKLKEEIRNENEKLRAELKEQNEKLYRLMQRMAEKVETESTTTKGQTPTAEGGDKPDDANISAMETDGGKQEDTAGRKEDSPGSGSASGEGSSNP